MATLPAKRRPSSEGTEDPRGPALVDFADFGLRNSDADFHRIEVDDGEDRHSGGDRLPRVDSTH